MFDTTLLADWFQVDGPVLALIVGAALLAGWVDAVVGGGGLIQLPALVIGLPKEVATPFVLGTNKISSFAGTLSASGFYLRRLRVRAVAVVPLLSGAFAGSAVGASASRQLPREWLTPIVLLAVLVVGAYVLLRPRVGLTHAPRHSCRGEGVRLAVLGCVVGAYDGLLGPGTGSFFVILIVAWLGYGFLEASVHAKLANLTTNAAAIVVYGVHGELLVALGLLMAVANVVGAVVGARMAVRHGSAFIRKVFLVVIAILVVKLGWDTATVVLGR